MQQGPPTVSLDSAFGNSYNTTMSTVPSTIKTFPNNVALDYKNRGTGNTILHFLIEKNQNRLGHNIKLHADFKSR